MELSWLNPLNLPSKLLRYKSKKLTSDILFCCWNPSFRFLLNIEIHTTSWWCNMLIICKLFQVASWNVMYVLCWMKYGEFWKAPHSQKWISSIYLPMSQMHLHGIMYTYLLNVSLCIWVSLSETWYYPAFQISITETYQGNQFLTCLHQSFDDNFKTFWFLKCFLIPTGLCCSRFKKMFGSWRLHIHKSNLNLSSIHKNIIKKKYVKKKKKKKKVFISYIAFKTGWCTEITRTDIWILFLLFNLWL